MLMIRLQRVGRKHEPVFRLVLTDSKTAPRAANFWKYWETMTPEGEKAEFKMDKIKHWISKGAKLSNTVHNILVERKVIEGKKINALPKKTALKKRKKLYQKQLWKKKLPEKIQYNIIRKSELLLVSQT